MSNESALISGLMALKQVVQSNEYMIDEERVHLNNLVEVFFPLLESVMGDLLSINPPPANKTLIEHLISKIFFAANNVPQTHPLIFYSFTYAPTSWRIHPASPAGCPFSSPSSRDPSARTWRPPPIPLSRSMPWTDTSSGDSRGSSPRSPTDYLQSKQNKIQRLIIRYTVLLIENRYTKQAGVSSVTPNQMQLNAFIDYFEKNHVAQILQLHLNIILQKR